MQTSVFITIDAEMWPSTFNWRTTKLGAEMGRDIYGKTSRGEFGLRFQLDTLDSFGLRAVFFVESLFAWAVPGRLGEIVKLIRGRGHELLKNRKRPGKPLLPDDICVRRFKRFCNFLADHRHQFRTATFAELALRSTSGLAPRTRILQSNVLRTARRYGQQMVRRIP